MRQQQLEQYLTHIEGIIDAAINTNNFATAIYQIRGLINQSKRKYAGGDEEASEYQQGAALRRAMLNQGSGQ